ncbi:hypothetical protein QBZ16_002140 [Prototheca wickerhamii]|uniref:Sugar phosphate transporter domain-containing protein n=1 Tax=Prototheca wickerhamii TaxID=3111 RepID=A0AAD9IN02_PROWI|nr:hypothetical protein QBZ16_002140 [Prototheca wickerhamii]
MEGRSLLTARQGVAAGAMPRGLAPSKITCQPQPVLSFTRPNGARPLATPPAAAAGEASKAPSGGLGQVIKTVLNSFPAPWFVSAFQLLASAVFMILLSTGASSASLRPVALFHTIGHVSACVSFSLMAVSFAHVVKAAEPVLSVGLSQLILGEINPWYVWASLLPIIGGCSLSAMKEVSFAWGGFNNAMISNFGMVMRNVYSKKSLSGATNKLDGINLFALLSIISFFYTLPVAIVVEGFRGGVWQWGPLWNQAVATLGQAQFYKLMAAAGLFYHLYNQASYMVLDQGISPVTFSVGNTMKRVAVVVSSVLFFRNPVSAMNWVGSLLAIAGTGLYSMAKQKASNDAKKAKQA